METGSLGSEFRLQEQAELCELELIYLSGQSLIWPGERGYDGGKTGPCPQDALCINEVTGE